ncbi:amidohydrolase family protein [Pseudochelatococcus sp. B33]
MARLILDGRSADIPGIDLGSRAAAAEQMTIADAVSQRLRELDESGVTGQVLCVSSERAFDIIGSSDQIAHVNRGLEAVMHRSDGRLTAIALVDLNQGDAGVASVERAFDRGFCGIALPTRYRGSRVDEDQFRPVLQAAQELGLPVILQSSGLADGGPPTNVRQQTHVGMPADYAVCISRMIFKRHFTDMPALKLLLPEGGGTVPALIARWDHGYTIRRECRAMILAPPSAHIRNLYIEGPELDDAAFALAGKVLGYDRLVFASGRASLAEAIDFETNRRRRDAQHAIHRRYFHGNAATLFERRRQPC